MPPMMEETFGYGGKLRFLEFSFSPKTRRFGYSDGGDHIPSNEELWLTFVNHPLIAVQLMDHDCPTLYGEFARMEAQPACCNLYWLTGDQVEAWHCLLFDRQQRRPYLCTRRQMIFFLPLTEPEGMEDHTLFVDGRLLSPGSENYKISPCAETQKRLVEWLDSEASELERWLHEEE